MTPSKDDLYDRHSCGYDIPLTVSFLHMWAKLQLGEESACQSSGFREL